MTKLLARLLTDLVGVIASHHKGVIATEEEFLDQMEPLIRAIRVEIKKNREQIVQV